MNVFNLDLIVKCSLINHLEMFFVQPEPQPPCNPLSSTSRLPPLDKTIDIIQFFSCFDQGCIFRLTCSHPELTEDHVLTSANVKIFRTVTRNAVNKSV